MPQNPHDALAARFKPFQAAQKRARRATEAREAAQARVAELEAGLAAAEHRDRVQLGEALVDARKPPKSEAGAARACLGEAKLQLEALQYAEERANTELDRLPLRHQARWLEDASGDLANACDRYRKAIHELGAARDLLADQAALSAYLRYSRQSQPISPALQQRLSDGSTRAIDFGQLVELMRDEADHAVEKARLDPNRPQTEPAWHRVTRA